MVRLLVALVVVGGRRLRHVAYLADDPLVRRFAGLRRLPSVRTVSRWLKAFTMTTVGRLQDLNAGIVGRVLPALGLRTVTIDVDGVVVSRGLQVARAFRGFNPHHRKVPSYYPILAHVAETTHILRVKNRSGNVHDGKASLPFLRELWEQLVATVTRLRGVRFRMDAAFFREDVLRWLGGRGVGSAIKVPFYFWLDLQAHIRTQRTWAPVAPAVSGVRPVRGHHAVGVPDRGDDLSQAGPPSHGPELSTRPLRSQRRVLRVLRRGQQSLAEHSGAVAFHERSGEPREDDRAAKVRTRLSHGTDQRLRRQQRVAAVGRVGAQPADELSNRHRRRRTAAVPEAYRPAPAPNRADPSLRGLPPGRDDHSTRRRDAITADGKCGDASQVHAARESAGAGGVILTH